MAHMVIGTAGHIDHGKTTLVKALTQMETDTTKEEKLRGLSINLGFAYLDLPNKKRVSIIDVPGHEKFIRNMIAGLPGLNLVLLVVDANEGIMPQTKEHIDILTLLGITEFIIVLTKVSTVDEEMKELVISDIKEQLFETLLSEVEIIETDALTGLGIEELKRAIQEKTTQGLKDKKQSPPRLNVDRAFSVKGFGTVVTGTLVEGTISLGDELICLPTGQKVRIRNIQVHEKDVKEATSGQRAALNLSNIKVDEINRGDVLTIEDHLAPAWMLDAKVMCLPRCEQGINLWERVRLLVGTKEVLARVVPIGADSIKLGEEGFIQFRLEEPLAVKQGDRFIIRSYSPLETIGGGVILDAAPKKHRRFKEEVVESLMIRDQGSYQELVLDFLQNKKDPITSVSELSQYLSIDEAEIEKIIKQLVTEDAVLQLGNDYLSMVALNQMKESVVSVIKKYHQSHRLRKWMPLEEFRSKIQSSLQARKLNAILSYLEEQGVILLSEKGITLSNFEIVLNQYHLKEKERIVKMLLESQFLPIKIDELVNENKNAQEVVEVMEEVDFVYLTHEYVIAKVYFDQAVQIVKDIINQEGEMSLADFRNATSSSRKASMLILEYFDKLKITQRVESVRILGSQA